MTKEAILEQIYNLKHSELDKLERIKKARLMRYLERKSVEEENKLKARGLCPHCHIYLPASGECDCEM